MKIEDVIAMAVRVGESVRAARWATIPPDPHKPVDWYTGLKYIGNQIWPHLPQDNNTYLATNWRRADNHEALTGREPPGTPMVMELRLDTGRHTGILTFYGRDVLDAYLDMAEFLGIDIKVPWIRCACGETFLGIRQRCTECREEVVTT